MAKNKEKTPVIKKNYYSRLLINKSMRASFIPVFISLFAVMAFMIYQINMRQESWLTILLPILAIGALCCLFPITEIWEYQTWQSHPERVERVTDK